MKINYDKGLLILENIEVLVFSLESGVYGNSSEVVDLYYDLYTCKFLYGKIKNGDYIIKYTFTECYYIIDETNSFDLYT